MPGPVIVVDYDPAWPRQFEQMRCRIQAALGRLARSIEHVGSTSVPDLAAKPVLDIDVVIEDDAALPHVIASLAPLGYEHRGELGVTGRHAFRAPDGGTPRHNLYVCAADGRELRRHVAFRDWLRTHPGDRLRYEALKRRLAVAYRDDRDGYCDAKRGLVEEVLVSALGEGFCTARTVSRPFCLDDAEYAHPVFGDARVMRFTSGDPDIDVAATARRLSAYVALQRTHGFSKWAVWDRASGAYLGDAGLTMLPETGEVELGYRLGRAHWGRGLATELAQAWLARALGPLGLDRVIAFADPHNVASIRVMEKIGMTRDREDRLAGIDTVVYAAVATR